MADLYQNELIKKWLEGQYLELFQYLNCKFQKSWQIVLYVIAITMTSFFIIAMTINSQELFMILGENGFVLFLLVAIVNGLITIVYPPIINPKNLKKIRNFNQRMTANAEFLGKMQLKDYDLIGKIMANSDLPKKDQRVLFYEALGRDTLKEWPYLKDWIHFYKAEYCGDIKKMEKIDNQSKQNLDQGEDK